jgi:MFS family permease
MTSGIRAVLASDPVHATPGHHAPPSNLRENLKLCTWDGITAVPLTVLSQPGNAVIAALLTGTFALSTRTYGVITSLPFWFNFLQVILTPLLAQRLSARALCIASAWMHVLGWLAFVAVLPFLPTGDHSLTRTAFIVIFSFIALSTAINGVAWNTWMQGAVPLRLRGKFFGRRNRLLYISLLGFLFAASGVLAWFEGSLLAFHVLLAVAITMRVISVLAQHRMHLTSGRKPASAETPWPEQVRRVWQDKTYMRFIAFAALMGFGVNLFAPFYPVFMFEQLHLSAAQTNFMLLTGIFAAAIAFPAWGHMSDRYGNIPVMIVALFLWQIFNFIWCFVTPENIWLLYVPLAAGGMFSAGYGVGVFGLLLKLTPPEARTMGVALFVSLSSLAAALGPITGSNLLSWAIDRGWPPLTVYHVAFVVMPVFTMLSCILLKKINEARSSRVTEVVGAMRNVRTVASLFGLTFLVNQVFYRTLLPAPRKPRDPE